MKRSIRMTMTMLFLWVAPAEAGILDFFKSPAELIMNQKTCFYMSKLVGETVSGKFIVESEGRKNVLFSMEPTVCRDKSADCISLTPGIHGYDGQPLKVTKLRNSVVAKADQNQESSLLIPRGWVPVAPDVMVECAL